MISRMYQLICIFNRNFKQSQWYLVMAFISIICYVVCSIYQSLYGTEFVEICKRYKKELIDLDQATIEFDKLFKEVFIATIGASIFYSMMIWFSQHLSIIWKTNLTNHFSKLYFTPKVFYRINTFDQSIIETPDLRMTKDVHSFISNLTNLLFGSSYIVGIFPSIGSAISFTYIILMEHGWQGVIMSYSSFIMFLFLNTWISQWVATKNDSFENSISTLQSVGGGIREHNETIAFYKGEKKEMKTMTNLFLVSIQEQKFNFNYNFALNFITNLYYWSSSILSYALPVGMFVYLNSLPSTKAEQVILIKQAEEITKHVNYYNSLQLVFSYAILLSETASQVLNYGNRVFVAIDRMEFHQSEIEKEEGNQQKEFNKNQQEKLMEEKEEEQKIISTSNRSIYRRILNKKDTVQVENVECYIANTNRIIVKNLNFSLKKNENLIIVGGFGCGKSSLLRVFAKLWSVVQGSIILPSNLFFLPQKPYLTYGTLKEQFIYPKSLADVQVSTEEIKRLMDTVKLSKLYKNHDIESDIKDWSNILSPGQQQSVAMARVLYYKPYLVLLDECTASVNDEMEEFFYKELINNEIQFISVAHRKTCKKYHQFQLHLTDEDDYQGNYELTCIGKIL